ncbi:MAG: hypothetical protein GQ544_06025 [Candidatus Aminicenantes bacterium]|nr:hypothetical protein [Candidatus Aminicenantes bacterium]
MLLLLGGSFNLNAEISYPWKEVYIGALDSQGWAGLAVAPNRESAFAFRVRIRREDQVADGTDFVYLVSEVGPHSPDGRYARMKFDLSLPFGRGRETPILKKPASKSNILTVEWSRQDEWTVVGKIRAPKNIEVQLVHYFPWEYRGKYQLLSDGQIQGESLSQQNFFYLFWTSQPGEISADSPEDEMSLSFSTEKRREIYFVVGVGEDQRILTNRIYRYKNEKTIDAFLTEEARLYNKKRVRVKGLYKGVAEAITNNLHWTSLYQAGEHRLYVPPGRRFVAHQGQDIGERWAIFEWSSFLNALALSIESTRHATDVVRSVLGTQYSNGNIPHWRSGAGGTPDRSQPPIGAYVVYKLFQKTGDMDLLRFSFPYLAKWHAFWKTLKSNGRPRRDGNGDGLLEWGSDEELVNSGPDSGGNVTGKQRAQWESGQFDLPTWDLAGYSPETGTLTMNCLDLNCLYALDAWCLAQIASVLDYQKDQRLYLSEYDELRALINDNFWDSREGFYFDKHWDGHFARRWAASNFYPLLARIPDQERAMRMVRHLLDEDKYWGDFVLPTISRDDADFKQQEVWKGAINPSTNYLVYQGLKAYGFDAEAYEFARKSAEVFLRSWENFQLCPEIYDARTGEARGHRFQSWGTLFALIAMEEYIDFTPWEYFRFGMLQPENGGELLRVALQGRHYDIKVNSGEIKLKEEGREIFRTNGGAVIRRFLYSEGEVSFEMMALVRRKVKIRFLSKGKYQFFLDNNLKRIFAGDSVEIEVPEGNHSVLILLIEKER